MSPYQGRHYGVMSQMKTFGLSVQLLGNVIVDNEQQPILDIFI